VKLRVISSKNDIDTLNPNEKLIHLAYHASNADYLDLMKKCPRLRMIQVLPSYHNTMSDAIQMFMDLQGIDVLEGDVHGYRKDMDEYFAIDDITMKEIVGLADGGASMEDLTLQIQEKVMLDSDIIKYIAKTRITA
jgi:hypothetical protein